MTLALVALAVLAVVVFAFVLEPVVRARGDRTVIDTVALPEHEAPLEDVEALEPDADEPTAAIDGDERLSGRRLPIDRPAGSDAS
ncbi:MAG TPA: hypothetical protein VFV93_18120 [Thermomicrobiales bacterium]|nr:hypothetical protein [Thermomicrobiales bacterium]